MLLLSKNGCFYKAIKRNKKKLILNYSFNKWRNCFIYIYMKKKMLKLVKGRHS